MQGILSADKEERMFSRDAFFFATLNLRAWGIITMNQRVCFREAFQPRLVLNVIP